jgi:hypothetical protein
MTTVSKSNTASNYPIFGDSEKDELYKAVELATAEIDRTPDVVRIDATILRVRLAELDAEFQLRFNGVHSTATIALETERQVLGYVLGMSFKL